MHLVASLCYFSIFFLLAKAWNYKKPDAAPTVQLKLGLAQGIVALADDGETYYFSYRGIPYAEPPVGERRFAAPVPYQQSWKGRRIFSEYKPHCIGLDNNLFEELESGHKIYKVTGVEDCLYINVHVPNIPNFNGQRKPVLFFIHGGFFSFGSPQDHEATILMERDDIVYVNFAYRVGPMGFLYYGDPSVPGNFGLKDQLLALKWVRDNIMGFGGDPEKVTIAGVDAGAASVHFMYLAAGARLLFRHGMSFSGTIYSPWAITNETTISDRSFELTHIFCDSGKPAELVKCVRKLDAQQFVEKQNELKIIAYISTSAFTPIIDTKYYNSFFSKNPFEILENDEMLNVPWMASVTMGNAFYPLAEFLCNKKRTDFLAKNGEVTLRALLHYPSEGCYGFTNILNAYMRNVTVTSYRDLLMIMYDRSFYKPLISSLQKAVKKNKQVYAYNFNYWGTSTTLSSIIGRVVRNYPGASNGDDVAYFLKYPGFLTKTTEDDKSMKKMMMDIVITFVYNATTPNYMYWPPITNGKLQEMMFIRSAESFYYKKQQHLRPKLVTQFDKYFYEHKSCSNLYHQKETIHWGG